MANPLETSPDNIHPDSSMGTPWQDFEDSWLFHQYDNFINGGVLYQNLAPGEAQYSEWSQQMTATMYQNWYNSAPEQMKRAMQAGINPFVAASGIAGSGNSPVAPSPNASNTNGLPGIIGSAAQGLSAVGGTFGNIAAGIATLSKLRHEIKKIDQDTSSSFESMGFTKLQSNALSVQLKYLDQREQIGVWQALANYDKTKQEYQNLSAQHANIIATYDEIIAHKDLMEAQEGTEIANKKYLEAMQGKVKAEADWQKTQNEFFTQHGYVLGSPLYESIRDMMINDGNFNMEAFGNEVASYSGKVAVATEHAKAQESWNYRPSNVTEAAAYIGTTIGSSLRELILNSQDVSNWSSLARKLKSNASASREFDEAYNAAKDDLYEEYLSKKRYYRHVRRGGNSQEVARAKNAMDTAKTNYEGLTKESFSEELIKSISPR